MGIGEQDPPRSESVHIGGECLWVPLETTDPVVKIIDRNEKNVRAPGTRSAHQNQSEKQKNQRTHNEDLPRLNASPRYDQTHVLIFSSGDPPELTSFQLVIKNRETLNPYALNTYSPLLHTGHSGKFICCACRFSNSG